MTGRPFVASVLSQMNEAIEDRFENIVIIQHETDFPIQDATTITGSEGYLYLITKPITTSKQFIGANCAIEAVTRTIPFLTFTGSGVAIQNTNDGRVEIQNIYVEAPNGTCFKAVGQNLGSEAGAAQRLQLQNVVATGKKIYDHQGAGALVMSVCNFVVDGAVLDAFTVNATNMLVYNMREVLVGGIPATGYAIDIGSSTSEEWEISDLIYRGDATGHVFKGVTGGGNTLTGGRFLCTGGNFIESATPLVNLDPKDIRTIFRDNAGVRDSTFSVDMHLNTTTLVTISTANVYVPITGGNWNIVNTSKLSADTNGLITNTSETSIEVKVLAYITGEAINGTDLIRARIVYNGDYTNSESAVTDNEGESNLPIPIPLLGVFILEPGETLQPMIANADDTTNINVHKGKLIISEKA